MTLPKQALSRILLSLAALLVLAQPVQAQDGTQDDDCSEPGMNGQCSEFGQIVMANQYDIRGDPVQVPVTIVLNTAYEEQAARWVLFSARGVDSAAGSAPVTVKFQGLSSSYGEVVTTKVEQPNPGEVNLWVDTLDTPLGTPIAFDLEVGATERGAYRLETLVMAFDRGYSPVKDAEGNDASLYSFSVIGVNSESSGNGAGVIDRTVPAAGVVPVLAAVAAAIALLRRRSV